MTPQDARRELARRELARRELSNRTEAAPVEPEKSSPYDAPYMKGLFQGGGQLIGGLTAGAMALPTGPGAIPAAVAGGIGGGLTGEAIRQLLASRTGGGPQSYGEQYQGLANAGAGAAVSEAALPVAGAIAKPIARMVGLGARHVYRNIPDPVLSWVKTRYAQGIDILNAKVAGAQDDIMRAVGKLGQAVKATRTAPDLLEPPSPKSLYPVAEKAANAFEAVREQAMAAYGVAADAAQEKPLQVGLTTATKNLLKELQSKGVLDAKGNPIQLGQRGFTGAEGTLLGMWNDLISLRPTGQPALEGTPGSVKYQMYRRLLDRIDESVGAVKGNRNAERILLQMRTTLEAGVKQADDALAKQIPAYGKFAGLRSMFETTLRDPDRTVTMLLSAGRDTKTGLRQNLETLNSLAPKDLQFLDDLTAYERKQAAVVLAKQAEKTVTGIVSKLKTPQQSEKIARFIFNQPTTTIKELEALEEVSGVKFLDEFKDMAARQAFKSYRPSSFGISSLPGIALGGTLGYGVGGPIGAGVGLMGSAAMSTPAIQGQMLRALLPKLLAAKRAQGMAGAIPSSLSFLREANQN